MSSLQKLAAFAALLAAIFGAAMALGAAVGPIDVSGGKNSGHMMTTTTATAVDGSGTDMAPVHTGSP